MTRFFKSGVLRKSDLKAAFFKILLFGKSFSRNKRFLHKKHLLRRYSSAFPFTFAAQEASCIPNGCFPSHLRSFRKSRTEHIRISPSPIITQAASFAFFGQMKQPCCLFFLPYISMSIGSIMGRRFVSL